MSRAPLGGVRGHQSRNRPVCAQFGVMGLFPAVAFSSLQPIQLRGFTVAGACSQSYYNVCHLNIISHF